MFNPNLKIMKRLFLVFLAIGFPLALMAQSSGSVTVKVGEQNLKVKSDKAIQQVAVTSIITENGYTVMDEQVLESAGSKVVIIPLAMDDIPIVIGAMDDIPIIKSQAMDDIPIIKNQAMDDIPIIKSQAMDDIPIIKTTYVVKVTTESGEVFVEVVE